jgi:hypothetical protein
MLHIRDLEKTLLNALFFVTCWYKEIPILYNHLNKESLAEPIKPISLLHIFLV